MKFRFVSLLLIAFLLITDNTIYAQNARAMRRRDASSLSRGNGEPRLSVGLAVGTLGVGIDARGPVSDKLNLRFGASLLPYTYKRVFDVDGGRSSAEGKATLNLSKFQLLAEYKLANSIRLVGGFAYFYQSGIVAEGQLLDGIKYADINLSPQEAGALKIGVNWNKINPYLGVSLLNDMPAGRFNVNIDLGVYYMGAPVSKWEATGDHANDAIVTDNIVKYKKILDEYISPYKFYPVLQFNFNYLVVRNN